MNKKKGCSLLDTLKKGNSLLVVIGQQGGYISITSYFKPESQ